MREQAVPMLAEKIRRKPRYELLGTQQAFYTRLTQDITHATSGVDLQFFMVQYDQHTRAFFASVEQAARRGIPVRFAIDLPTAEVLTPNPFTLLATWREAQRLNRLRRDEHLPIEIRFNKRERRIRNKLKSNHEKFAIVDRGTIHGSTYIGSSNIAGHFLNWHDYMLRTTDGAIASALGQDFDELWTKGKKGTSRIHLIDPATHTEIISDSKVDGKVGGISQKVLAEIESAKHTIWLETTYLDRGQTQHALIAAKKRNPKLDIRVLAPNPSSTNDIRFRLFPQLWLQPLVESGIEVYLYGKSHKYFTHAKTFIADDTAMTGSSNFTDDPIEGGNAEIVLTSQDPQLREQLAAWFLEGQKISQRYTGRIRRRRWFTKQRIQS